MTVNTIGILTDKSEKIEAYLGCVQLFFDANGIKDNKQVIVLLMAIRVRNLSQTFRRHFDSKPLVIAERPHFHRL